MLPGVGCGVIWRIRGVEGRLPRWVLAADTHLVEGL
jgi:hypothetical protein